MAVERLRALQPRLNIHEDFMAEVENLTQVHPTDDLLSKVIADLDLPSKQYAMSSLMNSIEALHELSCATDIGNYGVVALSEG